MSDTPPPSRKLPPSPILPADAPPMPGGPGAVPTRPREFTTKFDLDAAAIHVRQTAQNAQQSISAALRNLHSTAVNLRQTTAALSEENRLLWQSMQGVISLADIDAVATAFEGLTKQFEG